MNLTDTAQQLTEMLKKRNLQGDAMLTKVSSNTISYRMENFESITNADESNIILRVVVGKKHSVVSSNISSNAVSIIDKAEKMAKSAQDDQYVSLPEQYCIDPCNLNITSDEKPTIDWLHEQALSMEQQGLSHKGIDNSEGATASYSQMEKVVANTNGMLASYPKSQFNLSVSVLATGKNNTMERWYDYSSACKKSLLKNTCELADNAALTAIKKLNPTKVKSTKVPIVLSPMIASQFLSSFTRAINGNEVFLRSSFLKDSMNEQVFREGVSIIDDSLIESHILSRPFDDEGSPCECTKIVNDGVLTNWLLDTYSANRLNLCSNGKAVRRKSGISPSHSNLYMENGQDSVDHLIRDIKQGFYVMEIMGFGTNFTTGDYSQGAAGFWIENGKLTYPVSEVTIAGNLKTIFANLVPANDLKFQYGINSPTLLLGEMMVAGS